MKILSTEKMLDGISGANIHKNPLQICQLASGQPTSHVKNSLL